MTEDELKRSGKWDYLKDCPLRGYDISLVSESTKAAPAGPHTESDKDIALRRLEGRCRQMSKQLKEANAEIFRLRNMHHLQVAGYVKHEMVDMMSVGHADHTRIYSTARQQFNHPVYRVRIKPDEPAT